MYLVFTYKNIFTSYGRSFSGRRGVVRKAFVHTRHRVPRSLHMRRRHSVQNKHVPRIVMTAEF